MRMLQFHLSCKTASDSADKIYAENPACQTEEIKTDAVLENSIRPDRIREGRMQNWNRRKENERII